MFLPHDGTKVKSKDFEADYILFVDQIECHSTKGYGNVAGVNTYNYGNLGSGNPTYSYGKAPTFEMSCEYVLWDNLVGEIVAYGIAEAIQPLEYNLNRGELTDCVIKLSKDIIFHKPFKKKEMPTFY